MSGRVLAVDWGTRRIGLAVSDESQTLAQPLATLTRRAGRRFPLKQLRAHLEAQRPVAIVMGLPLTPEGGEGDAAQSARAAGDLIAARTGLPVYFVDERLTTARAHRAIADLGGGTRGRKAEIDQLAAVVLLQQYLDSRGR